MGDFARAAKGMGRSRGTMRVCLRAACRLKADPLDALGVSEIRAVSR